MKAHMYGMRTRERTDKMQHRWYPHIYSEKCDWKNKWGRL